MRASEGPFTMETTYTWRAVDATTTRMTLRNRDRPPGFSALLSPLMARAVRRANRGDLRRLAALVART